MKWPTAIASALFRTTAVPLLAGTFDNASVAPAGAVPVVRILNCDLVKTSFKGSNEGWFSSADKSLIFVNDQGSEDPAFLVLAIYALD